MSKSSSLFFFVAALISVFAGTVLAMLWYYGLFPSVRTMLPYAIAFAMVILAVSTVIAVRLNIADSGPFDPHKAHRFPGFNRYFIVIVVMAIIFITFSLVVLSTYTSLAMHLILAFTGSISFILMVLTFIGVISAIVRRC